MAEQWEVAVVTAGKHLNFVKRGSWEYVDRAKASGAAALLAVTDEGRLVLTEQYRPPLDAMVIDLPAGLIGDEADNEHIAEAARRELIEETGFDATVLETVYHGPSAAGCCSEVYTLVRATGLRQVGEGGGVDNENIVVRYAPVDRFREWAREQESKGRMIDPKIYAALYFL